MLSMAPTDRFLSRGVSWATNAMRSSAHREPPPILVVSRYVEQLYARELLADGVGAVGYLLKDRCLTASRSPARSRGWRAAASAGNGVTETVPRCSPGVYGRGCLPKRSKWDNRDVIWIELEGAVNVRDLGGLPTSDGGATVPGRILRSENLQELSPADVAKLVDELGLTTVVDLRSTNEVAIEGPAPLDAVPGVRHAHHPVLREFLDVSDTVKAALVTESAAADTARYPDDVMTGHYLGYLENRPEEVAGALRSIATAPGAAIVHCAAGKDRTGVIVALALTAAGVELDAIVADYAVTNERLEAIVARLARSKMYAGVTSAPVKAHAPRAETMKAFLEQMEVRYGGVRAWLTDHGFGPGEIAQLRAKLRQA